MPAVTPSTEAIRTRATRGDAHRQEQTITTSQAPLLVYASHGGAPLLMSKRDLLAPTPDDCEKFRTLADTWRKETRRVSSLSKISMHPAYQKIIGMGVAAIPLILQEMVERGGHWLWALHAITDKDPAPENATFHEAVEAWISWGEAEGYLT